MAILLLVLLICHVSGQTTFLSYWQLVKAHGARRYWELSDLQNVDNDDTGDFLVTTEYFTKQQSSAANVQLMEKSLMDYECEVSTAMEFSGDMSKVDRLLPDWYMMPLNPGWTIDGWIFYRGIGGTILSSWGPNSQRWKIHFTGDLDQLTFTWSEETMPLGWYKSCSAQPAMDDYKTGWHHFAVRYTASVTTTDNIEFFLDGQKVPNAEPSGPLDTCGKINRIVANHSIPMTLGATWTNGTINEEFLGSMAKIAIYHQPVTDSQLAEHALRLSISPPCSRHGTCSSKGRCMCYPLWYGDICDKSFYVNSISPNEGSYYGMTPITIDGANFDAVNFSSIHVRIGPSISHFDNWAGQSASYGQCSIVNKTATQIICVTQAWGGRGSQNVSVVAYEAAGVPVNRPVFSMCGGASVEDCYFHPELLRTPRIWSYSQWALPGSLLTFKGQYFTYDDFTMLFVAPSRTYECTLEGATGDSQFSCRLPENVVAGYYTVRLAMLPNGGAWPLPGNVYVHPRYVQIYPLYPVEPRNTNCPTAGFTVQLVTPDVSGSLNETQIRVYDAPCLQRRVTDYHWLVDKVNPDYWQTYGYDSCPPYLVSYTSTMYNPNAFTLYNTLKLGTDYNSRKPRRFVDSTGQSHCLMMELG